MMKEVLTPHLNSISIPTNRDKIYKEECVFSFHDQESEGGILVDMRSFLCFSPKFSLLNFNRTKHPLYLNIRKKRFLDESEQSEIGKITKLGIGIEGGFKDALKKYRFETTYSIVLLPSGTSFPYPDDNLPDKIKTVAKLIIEAESQEKNTRC